MLENRSTSHEILDTPNIPLPDLIQNLQEFEKINKFLGSKRALLKALNSLKPHLLHSKIQNHVIRIADLGCGAGDLSIAIAKWCASNKINYIVSAVDINPSIIEYAQKNFLKHPELKVSCEVADILSPDFLSKSFDIVCLNNVCHHFDTPTLIELFATLSRQTKLAFIINDLHRNIIPYYAIKLITKIFRMSYLAQHDGPASVLRGFKKDELVKILQAAGIRKYHILWIFPFRWEIICGEGSKLE